MKSNLLVLVIIFLGSLTLKAQTPASEYTFNFYKGTFEQALKEASKKKKLIFVDAYTSWCGPCKMMNSNTFKNVPAGEYFNANFISMKIDMEVGEGPAFAMKYGVRAYPTLLFINSKGEVIHKVLGFREGPGLVEEGKKAIALVK